MLKDTKESVMIDLFTQLNDLPAPQARCSSFTFYYRYYDSSLCCRR